MSATKYVLILCCWLFTKKMLNANIANFVLAVSLGINPITLTEI